MKNNIGIMVPFFTEIQMKKRLELMKQAGFNSFMMSLDRNHEKFTDKLESIVDYCNEIGLEIGSGHAPYIDPDVNTFWTNTKRGDEIEEMYMDTLKFAHKHGIKTVVFHLHFEKNAELNKYGLARLQRMVDYAQEHKVYIAVENLYKYDELDYIFSNIKSEHIGFCYDSGHENFLTPNADFIFKYPNKLFALHLNDNNGEVDQHSTIFTGTVNWGKVVKGLAKANKINLDAEIRIHRPEGQNSVSEETLLKLYKKEFEALSQLEKIIEFQRETITNESQKSFELQA